MSRLIDADALMADCQLAQKQADRHGREFANAFYSGGGEISTEWWCVEDMIENAPTIESERKTARWIPRGCGCFECDECGEQVTLNAYTAEKASDRFRFCYHCGARMMEGETDGR